LNGSPKRHKVSDVQDALHVLFADSALVVVNKPSGLLAVPGRGEDKQDCLSARVQAEFADALIVHRLDMATSGLMIFARGIEMQRTLNAAFAAREVHKRYVAVAHGHIKGPPDVWQTIDLPIQVDWPNRPLRVIHEDGKPSVTRLRPLQYDATAHTTRVELEPVTGRSHQLRVHLQAIGHPLLGDSLYAPSPVQLGAARLLLHATRLELRHPVNALLCAWDSPADF
jgi:tRNA pseudouridine32 synthase/23S rRNA pseudouridine746 synthase